MEWIKTLKPSRQASSWSDVCNSLIKHSLPFWAGSQRPTDFVLWHWKDLQSPYDLQAPRYGVTQDRSLQQQQRRLLIQVTTRTWTSRDLLFSCRIGLVMRLLGLSVSWETVSPGRWASNCRSAPVTLPSARVGENAESPEESFLERGWTRNGRKVREVRASQLEHRRIYINIILSSQYFIPQGQQ